MIPRSAKLGSSGSSLRLLRNYVGLRNIVPVFKPGRATEAELTTDALRNGRRPKIRLQLERLTLRSAGPRLILESTAR
jgi:hypothetical protein